MRLVGGGYHDRGTIQVYHNGQWGTICDDSFDKNDGDVICRMLGFNFSRYILCIFYKKNLSKFILVYLVSTRNVFLYLINHNDLLTTLIKIILLVNLHF